MGSGEGDHPRPKRIFKLQIDSDFYNLDQKMKNRDILPLTCL